jgi:hypothetical protein
MPPKVLTLPRNEIEHCLSITGLSAQDIRALLRAAEWCALQSRNQRVLFLYDYARSECSTSLPAAIMGQVFEIHEAHVWKTRSKAQKTARPGHRPFALSSEQEDAIVALIERGYGDGNFVTHRYLLNFAESEFGNCLTYGWVHCFLARTASRVCQSIVSLQEQTRFHVHQSSLDQYLALIKEWMSLVPAESMFNIDECRFSDWKERKPKLVLIPCRVNNVTLHYQVDRGIRHQAVICCVTAARDAYCPFLVSADQSVRQIFEIGVQDSIDLNVEITSSPYVTQVIFNKYIHEGLIPVVISNRGLPGYKDKPAILFCDNCSLHCSDEMLGKYARCGILVITYPPNT